MRERVVFILAIGAEKRTFGRFLDDLDYGVEKRVVDVVDPATHPAVDPIPVFVGLENGRVELNPTVSIQILSQSNHFLPPGLNVF
jgi:hypothetical protein